MQACELGFPKYLVAEFPPALHDCTKHLVVASASEENLAGVEFEERTADRPNVDTEIIWHSEDCDGHSVYFMKSCATKFAY